MPPPTVQPLRVSDCWIPVLIGAPMFQRDLSIFAHAPPPVTYRSVLGPNHQKLVKPSRPRAVTSQRSWVSEIQAALVVPPTGTRAPSNCWPDLLVADPSPSMPKTHAPACQLQPSVPPPMKPETSKLSVIGAPAGSMFKGSLGLLSVEPAVVKCWLRPHDSPALAPT